MKTYSFMKQRMVRSALVFSAAVLLSLVSWTVAAPLPAQDRHFLWSVEAGPGRVRLMGSIHTLRRDAYPLPPALEQAYEEASKLVLETDMARMNDPAVQARLLGLGLYPEGETLPDMLSREAYEELSSALEERGIPPARFSRFKPWFCAFTLMLLELQRLGYDPRYGLDAHFFERAQRDGKAILHLEPVEAQIDLLASLEQSGKEEDFLFQSLQELEILESMASRMTEAWRTGDTADLHALMNKGFEGFPDLHDRFITERNRNWLPAIEDLILNGEEALIVVGAGHLVGPQGLVRLLEDLGYAVVQH